ncbi:MAG: GNAT family N-acetyltransferase [Deltaproteobacteria bacterium]|jgi:RimJ/RimL family protein N-acetyltransferase
MIPQLPPHVLQRRRLVKDKKGSPFVIRLYQDDEKDYAAISELYRKFEPKELSQGLPPRLEQKREEWLRYVVHEGINVLAIMDGKVVGHAALFEMERDKSFEYLVFIHQDYQNRGIGTALTRMMRELVREMGYSQIWLTVESRNFKAIHVYEKVGFCFVGPRDIECVMMLPLLGEDDGF